TAVMAALAVVAPASADSPPSLVAIAPHNGSVTVKLPELRNPQTEQIQLVTKGSFAAIELRTLYGTVEYGAFATSDNAMATPFWGDPLDIPAGTYVLAVQGTAPVTVVIPLPDGTASHKVRVNTAHPRASVELAHGRISPGLGANATFRLPVPRTP